MTRATRDWLAILATLIAMVGAAGQAVREWRWQQADSRQSWDNHGWAAEQITVLQYRVETLEKKCGATVLP